MWTPIITLGLAWLSDRGRTRDRFGFEMIDHAALYRATGSGETDWMRRRRETLQALPKGSAYKAERILSRVMKGAPSGPFKLYGGRKRKTPPGEELRWYVRVPDALRAKGIDDFYMTSSVLDALVRGFISPFAVIGGARSIQEKPPGRYPHAVTLQDARETRTPFHREEMSGLLDPARRAFVVAHDAPCFEMIDYQRIYRPEAVRGHVSDMYHVYADSDPKQSLTCARLLGEFIKEDAKLRGIRPRELRKEFLSRALQYGLPSAVIKQGRGASVQFARDWAKVGRVPTDVLAQSMLMKRRV